MNKERFRSVVKWGLFILYIAVMTYFMFFAERFDRVPSDEYRYNLVPFREINRFISNRDILGMGPVMLNILGNIEVFIPFGMALVSISRGRMGFWTVTVYSAALSIAIELLQLVMRVGSCDVDDIMLNTLGGIIGYLIYFIAKGRGRRKNETF